MEQLSAQLYAVVGILAALLAGVAAVAIYKRRARDAVSKALGEAADRLGFVLNEEREIAGNVNNDEYWCDRIVGVHTDRSVVAGRYEVVEVGAARDEYTSHTLAEVHVDLGEWWDCGVEVVSRDAPDYGDHGKYLEPMETGDENFDGDFEVRVQLSEDIQEVLLSDEVSSLLRELDRNCQRLRIADGTLQLRWEAPFDEPQRWVEVVERAVQAADDLDDVHRDDD